MSSAKGLLRGQIFALATGGPMQKNTGSPPRYEKTPAPLGEAGAFLLGSESGTLFFFRRVQQSIPFLVS